MSGPCLCGDYMCSSCGPAQGYDPKYEAIYDKVCEELPHALVSFNLTVAQVDDLIETVTNRISTMLSASELDNERRFHKQLEEEERLAKEWYDERTLP